MLVLCPFRTRTKRHAAKLTGASETLEFAEITNNVGKKINRCRIATLVRVVIKSPHTQADHRVAGKTV